VSYAFGHTDLAAERLALVAEVVAASTEPFLRECPMVRPKLAVDLGCGPGHSTRLLAEVLQPEQLVGLDISDRFLATARQGAIASVRFQLHDLRNVPFPLPTLADLLYSRFELVHLQEPLGTVASWMTQLRPGGLLLLEEPEDIQTTNPALARYLEILDAMLADQGSHLYIGPMLDAMEAPPDAQRRSSSVRRLAVANRTAARMFLMNLRTWREQPFVRKYYSSAAIARLQEDLSLVASRPENESDITWFMRQIAVERIS